MQLLLSQIYKIGVLYNEAVKTLNYYHSTATAQRMLRKIETYSEAIIKQQVQAIKLTEEYSNTEYNPQNEALLNSGTKRI